MKNYIDGFVFPIPTIHLDEYQKVAEKVAEIWKEYGALSYNEFIRDDIHIEGTLSFPEVVHTTPEEVIVFGWIAFESRATRDSAHKSVENDSRMNDLVSPLVDPTKIIFDASRMIYGGFKPLIQE